MDAIKDYSFCYDHHTYPLTDLEAKYYFEVCTPEFTSSKLPATPVIAEDFRALKLCGISSTDYQRMKKPDAKTKHLQIDESTQFAMVVRQIRSIAFVSTQGLYEISIKPQLRADLPETIEFCKNMIIWRRGIHTTNPDYIGLDTITGRLVPIELKTSRYPDTHKTGYLLDSKGDPVLDEKGKKKKGSVPKTEDEIKANIQSRYDDNLKNGEKQVYHAMYVLNSTLGYVGVIQIQADGELILKVSRVERPNEERDDRTITVDAKELRAILNSKLSILVDKGYAAFKEANIEALKVSEAKRIAKEEAKMNDENTVSKKSKKSKDDSDDRDAICEKKKENMFEFPLALSQLRPDPNFFPAKIMDVFLLAQLKSLRETLLAIGSIRNDQLYRARTQSIKQKVPLSEELEDSDLKEHFDKIKRLIKSDRSDAVPEVVIVSRSSVNQDIIAEKSIGRRSTNKQSVDKQFVEDKYAQKKQMNIAVADFKAKTRK